MKINLTKYTLIGLTLLTLGCSRSSEDYADEDYEKLYKESQKEKSKTEAVAEDADRLKHLEKSIERTLSLAEAAAEETKAALQRSAMPMPRPRSSSTSFCARTGTALPHTGESPSSIIV